MSDTDLPQTSATRVTFRFMPPEAPGHPGEAVQEDLSAAARIGDTLFLACDETTGIERLRRAGDGTWAAHRHFDLGEIFDLPGGKDEADIEALDIHDGWLWVTGSHSLKRNKPGGGLGLDALAVIKTDRNRQLLCRVPLADTSEGPMPVARDGDRTAAHLKFTKRGKLRKMLRDDPLIGPFLSVPSKENGFDVEGLAAHGDRVWLGLRGPVLRGFAVILELELKRTGAGHLKARKIDGAKRYRTHVIDTGGAGIRDLTFDGGDLLILTGTPLAGTGRAEILRWTNAVGCRTSGIHGAAEISVALNLPYRAATDNPEGLTRWDEDTWLVVHDSPHPERLLGEETSYKADVWRLTG